MNRNTKAHVYATLAVLGIVGLFVWPVLVIPVILVALWNFFYWLFY